MTSSEALCWAPLEVENRPRLDDLGAVKLCWRVRVCGCADWLTVARLVPGWGGMPREVG